MCMCSQIIAVLCLLLTLTVLPSCEIAIERHAHDTVNCRTVNIAPNVINRMGGDKRQPSRSHACKLFISIVNKKLFAGETVYRNIFMEKKTLELVY